MLRSGGVLAFPTDTVYGLGASADDELAQKRIYQVKGRPVGLRFFVGGFSQQWGYFAAGSIIVSIPVVLLFLYLQKYLVSGLTAGGVKG